MEYDPIEDTSMKTTVKIVIAIKRRPVPSIFSIIGVRSISFKSIHPPSSLELSKSCYNKLLTSWLSFKSESEFEFSIAIKSFYLTLIFIPKQFIVIS